MKCQDLFPLKTFFKMSSDAAVIGALRVKSTAQICLLFFSCYSNVGYTGKVEQHIACYKCSVVSICQVHPSGHTRLKERRIYVDATS